MALSTLQICVPASANSCWARNDILEFDHKKAANKWCLFEVHFTNVKVTNGGATHCLGRTQSLLCTFPPPKCNRASSTTERFNWSINVWRAAPLTFHYKWPVCLAILPQKRVSSVQPTYWRQNCCSGEKQTTKNTQSVCSSHLDLTPLTASSEHKWVT